MIFIESKLFEKLREKYLDDENYRSFQNFLIEQPLVGDMIQGTGGLRKVRWGIRTIYFYFSDKQHIHLLTVYAKNEVTDLTPQEKKILKAIVEEIQNA